MTGLDRNIEMIFTRQVKFGKVSPFDALMIVHPSIFYTRLSCRSGRGGAGAYLSSSQWVRSRGLGDCEKEKDLTAKIEK